MSSATVLPASAPPRKKVTIPSLMKKMKAGEAIVQMASGELSKSELLGFGAEEISPWRVGAVL